MTNPNLSPDAARFLRTLRVATATALAGADLASGVGRRPATTFLALAAKGRNDWRFPAEGLMSADGLVRATLVAEAGSKTLALQALGAAGLMRYAEKSALLKLHTGAELAGRFDHDGALRVSLGAVTIAESDLAGFGVEFEDEGP